LKTASHRANARRAPASASSLVSDTASPKRAGASRGARRSASRSAAIAAGSCSVRRSGKEINKDYIFNIIIF
jgi:hypothetical protein